MVPGGYRWWYLDALSDDHGDALTLIAFVGSVFSPYYAGARRRGDGDPLDHVAVNVALYGRRRAWAMTERGRGSLTRDGEHLAIADSRLEWRGDALEITVAERTAPWGRRLSGRIRVWPLASPGLPVALDGPGRHRWTPLAPLARAEVALDAPKVRWQGAAYLDSNAGDAPLEADFARWNWSRTLAADGRTLIHYDVERQDGTALALALATGTDGRLAPEETVGLTSLPRSGWGLARQARGPCTLAATLEDGPFYTRSLLARPGRAWAVHESLSLDRFRRPWVRALLPFRMPRHR